MGAPQGLFYPEPQTEDLLFLFRIIYRGSWDEFQSWREVLPESRIEHVLYGIYVLIIPPGATRRIAR